MIPKEALADAIAAVKSGLAEGKTNATLMEIKFRFLGIARVNNRIPPAEADPPENRPEKSELEKKEGPFVVETIDGFEVSISSEPLLQATS